MMYPTLDTTLNAPLKEITSYRTDVEPTRWTWFSGYHSKELEDIGSSAYRTTDFHDVSYYRTRRKAGSRFAFSDYSFGADIRVWG